MPVWSTKSTADWAANWQSIPATNWSTDGSAYEAAVSAAYSSAVSLSDRSTKWSAHQETDRTAESITVGTTNDNACY